MLDSPSVGHTVRKQLDWIQAPMHLVPKAGPSEADSLGATGTMCRARPHPPWGALGELRCLS